MRLSKDNIRNSINIFRKGLTFIIGIYLLSWILKGLFISIYVVPTSSMYPTIQRGDYIMALKFPYRFKTPEFYPLTAVPFPFYAKPGFVQPSRADIWVFSSPIHYDRHPSKRMRLVKRLAGLPGDTLYTLGNKIVSLTDSITTLTKKYIIPKEGMTVHLDSLNISYWKRLIQRDGSYNKVNADRKALRIDGSQASTYRFKSNFYFMLGDNEGNTRDSRHWGAVPEELLIARAVYIIWRKDKGFILRGL